MPTAKEQLLSMMSPQAARLLDQQMRSQQVAQRSQGAGMLSGLVQAYTGMSDAFQGITSGMPMGAMEMQARQQEKAQDEINTALKGVKTSEDYFRAADKLANSSSLIARAKSNELRQEGMRLRQQEENASMQKRQMAMREQEFSQNMVLNAQKQTQNEMQIKATKLELEDAEREGKEEARQSLLVDDLLTNFEGISPVKKELIKILPPDEALEQLSKIEDDNKNKKLASVANNYVSNVFFKDVSPTSKISSSALNNRYLGAINYYRNLGLSDKAEQLEEERKAVVEQKLTVEEREQGVKDKWQTNKSANTQRSVASSASKGLSVLREGGGIAEIASLVQFFKTIDPESVVKESEIQMATSVAGLIDSIVADFEKAKGEGVLPDSLRTQLQDFFVTIGSTAVESYNESLREQKESYTGRDMDVEFMFGSEISLKQPTQDRPEDYRFNITNLKQPVNKSVLTNVRSLYNDTLEPEVKQYIQGVYEQTINSPENFRAAQQQAIDKYGFDALGYLAYELENRNK